jgi:hypothetical protein
LGFTGLLGFGGVIASNDRIVARHLRLIGGGFARRCRLEGLASPVGEPLRLAGQARHFLSQAPPIVEPEPDSVDLFA